VRKPNASRKLGRIFHSLRSLQMRRLRLALDDKSSCCTPDFYLSKTTTISAELTAFLHQVNMQKKAMWIFSSAFMMFQSTVSQIDVLIPGSGFPPSRE